MGDASGHTSQCGKLFRMQRQQIVAGLLFFNQSGLVDGTGALLGQGNGKIEFVDLEGPGGGKEHPHQTGHVVSKDQRQVQDHSGPLLVGLQGIMDPAVIQHVVDDDIRLFAIDVGDEVLLGDRPLGQIGLAESVGGAQFKFTGFQVQDPQNGPHCLQRFGDLPNHEL